MPKEVRPQPQPDANKYRQAIDEFLGVLDSVDVAALHRSIHTDKHRRYKMLHGFVFYVRDTAHSALHLLDIGQSGSATALTRIALEHSILIQWLSLAPDRPDEFLRQQEYEAGALGKVIDTVGMKVPADVRQRYQSLQGMKRVPSLASVREMFKQVDESEWLYLQYKVLCAEVHPSATTGNRYMSVGASGGLVLLDKPRDRFDNAEVYTLALSVALAVAPYVDLIRGKPYKAEMQRISNTYEIPLWSTVDGKPPKRSSLR